MKRLLPFLFVCSAFGTDIMLRQTGYTHIFGEINTTETSADTVQLDTTFVDGNEEGRIQWNSEDGTIEYGLPGGNVNLQVGFETLMKAVNKTGATISNGTPVYVSGAQGSRPTIALADADNTNAFHAVGLTTEDIANNASGYVCTYGYVRGIDTSDFEDGDSLYLSTTSGVLTNGVPAYPAEAVHIGTVVFANADSGIINVTPHIEITYDELSRTAIKFASVEVTATNIYNDLKFSASEIDLAGLANPPDKDIVSGCITVLSFDNSGNEEIYYSGQFSHEYWQNTPIEVHGHFLSGGTVETSTWEVVTAWESNGSMATLTTNEFTYVSSGVDGHVDFVYGFNLTNNATGVSDMIAHRLKRKSGGTANEIRLLEMDDHFRIKYLGGSPY